MENPKRKLSSHHGLGLGIEGSDEIRRILLLKSDSGLDRMIRIVLEDASSGIIDQNQASLPADVSESESPDDVGADGLDLVGLAPVDVGAAGDTGGVEDVSGIDSGDVGLEGGAVLETAGAVDEAEALGLAELAEEAANPAGAAVDQELQRLLVCSVGREPHSCC